MRRLYRRSRKPLLVFMLGWGLVGGVGLVSWFVSGSELVLTLVLGLGLGFVLRFASGSVSVLTSGLVLGLGLVSWLVSGVGWLLLSGVVLVSMSVSEKTLSKKESNQKFRGSAVSTAHKLTSLFSDTVPSEDREGMVSVLYDECQAAYESGKRLVYLRVVVIEFSSLGKEIIRSHVEKWQSKRRVNVKSE